MIEKTLVIVKPDGVERGLVGQIMTRFEQAGLKIIALKMMAVKREHAQQHYEAHKDKPFFHELVDFITDGPVVAFVLEGVHAVENARRLVGTTSPHSAPPGTIRGDFAHMSMKYASEFKRGGKNLIHASGTLDEAQKEITLWFSPRELCTYSTVHEKHVF